MVFRRAEDHIAMVKCFDISRRNSAAKGRLYVAGLDFFRTSTPLRSQMSNLCVDGSGLHRLRFVERGDVEALLS